MAEFRKGDLVRVSKVKAIAFGFTSYVYDRLYSGVVFQVRGVGRHLVEMESLHSGRQINKKLLEKVR